MEDITEKFPLVLFSVYSQVQADILRNEGARLAETLDGAFSDRGVDGKNFNAAYGQFWLWTLGAYEFTRTLTQHSKCFSGGFAETAQAFKKSVAILRMPFAKQELAGKFGSKLKAEASVSAVDQEAKDLGFSVGDQLPSFSITGKAREAGPVRPNPSLERGPPPGGRAPLSATLSVPRGRPVASAQLKR